MHMVQDINCITEIEMEHNWQKYHYGRCILCGEGFKKDDWRFERIIFEDQYGEDPLIWEYMETEAWTNQSHEGNGVCYCCASDVMFGKYKDNDEKKELK